MANICPNCKSSFTQAGLHTIFCLSCGRETHLVDGLLPERETFPSPVPVVAGISSHEEAAPAQAAEAPPEPDETKEEPDGPEEAEHERPIPRR